MHGCSWVFVAGLGLAVLISGCRDQGCDLGRCEGENTDSDVGDGDGDGDGDGACGKNLHDDDSTCGNGVVDPGEICFGEEFVLTPPDPRGWFLEVGDFDADGHVDILQDVYVWLGDGAGGFSGPFQWGAEIQQEPWSPAAVGVGEANGEPGDDILFTAGDTGDVYGISVVFGGADFPDQGPAQELADNPRSVSAGDFDSDGVDDVLLIVDSSAILQWEARWGINDGAGNFDIKPIFEGREFTDGQLADVDADGLVDMVLASPSPGNVFMLSQGDASFEEVNVSPNDLRVRNSAYGHDLDCDGIPDLVQGLGANIQLWRGLGGASYELALDFDSKGGSAPQVQAIGDVNADGALDVLSTNGVEDRVFLGNSAFALEGPIEIPVLEWNQAEMADFNEDGAMDFVGLRYGGVDVVLADP